MSVRSHKSLSWVCCGVRHSYDHSYCYNCGQGVITADRVLLQWPLKDGGSVAVISTATLDAAEWRMLGDLVARTAEHFTAHEEAELRATPPSETRETGE